MNAELMATDEFEVMSLEADEDEHSIEMHLPYVARVMQTCGSDDFSVVPVLVGSLSPEKEAKYGRIFAKYLSDPQNLFIISSDFCHWGSRFRYTEYDDQKGTNSRVHQDFGLRGTMAALLNILLCVLNQRLNDDYSL